MGCARGARGNGRGCSEDLLSVLLRHRHAREAEKSDRVRREIAREAQDRPVVTGVTPAGDERRLRGIPVIGRGVSGDMNA